MPEPNLSSGHFRRGLSGVAEGAGNPLASLGTLDEITAQLYERILTRPQNRLLMEAVEGPADPLLMAHLKEVCLVLVPGLLYRQFPETGSDGAVVTEIANSMSIPVITIPLDGTEGLEKSAAVIGEWLQAHVPPEKAIVLVSLSKGSAEIMHALAQPGIRPAFQRVIAWISVCGLPFGTPSMEMLMKNRFRRAVLGAYCYFKGWRLATLRALLAHRPSNRVALPAHMTMIQVVPFPLHRHLRSRQSRRLHRRLARLGPNDGYALLEELARLPGYLYPVWGADHCLQGMDGKSARLARLLAFVIQTTCRKTAMSPLPGRAERYQGARSGT